MSEEKNVIFCTQCGSENDASSRFCKNCGTKLEQPAAQPQESEKQQEDCIAEQTTQPGEGVFSGENAAPVYEKVTDAEEVKPTPIPNAEDIHINYEQDRYSTPYSEPAPQYSPIPEEKEQKTGGNIGVAIASLVCGIISLICCCFTAFSIIMGIAAVVLGIITICFKYDGKGMAIAGIATGAVGMVFLICGVILSGTAMYQEMIEEIASSLY